MEPDAASKPDVAAELEPASKSEAASIHAGIHVGTLVVVRAASVAVLLVDVVLAIALPSAAAYVVPSFRKVFKDFDTELPSITRSLLGAPFGLWLLAAAGIVVLLVLKEVLIRNPKVALWLNLAVGLLLVVVVVVGAVALFSPVLTLVHKLAA